MAIYPVFRCCKVKSTSAVKHLLNEQQRAELERCARADSAKLGLDSFSCTAAEAFQRYQDSLPPDVRKNAVYGLNFVVSASKSFSDWKPFFEDARTWLSDNFGAGNCVAWAEHFDETSPHMQLLYIPLVPDKNGIPKLNARKLIGGSSQRMVQLQNDFYEKVAKKYGMDKPIPKKETHRRHDTAEQYDAELRRKEKDISEREKKLEKEKENLIADYRTECKVAETADNASLPKPKTLETARAYEKRVAPVFDAWVQTAVGRKKMLAEQVKETARKIAEAVEKEASKWKAVIVEWKQKVEALTAERDALKERVKRFESNTPAMLRTMADAVERSGCKTVKDYRQQKNRAQDVDRSDYRGR